MTVKDLRPALRAFLLADAAISAAVGGRRIYPVVLPQGIDRLSLVYSRISGLGDNHMQGSSGLSFVTYQIDAWALDPDLAAELSNLVKFRLDGYQGTMGTGAAQVFVQGVFLQTERTGYDEEPKLFSDGRDYRIVFEER